MSNVKAGDLEQIFTSPKIAHKLIGFLQTYYKGSISEILEPCAGDGSLSAVIKQYYPNIPLIEYDIEPQRDGIIQANFLKLKIKYKKGRVVLMNPPFSKAMPFIRKCSSISDYIVSITGSNTFINVNYNTHHVDKVYLKKKAYFKDGNHYEISILPMYEKKIF